MNEFSLWLQNEVNCTDINHYLYLFSLRSIKKRDEVMELINLKSNEMIEKNIHLQQKADELHIDLIVTDQMQKGVYATYNPNDNTIKVNKQWLSFLLRFMSEKESLDFCISHEIAHVLEDKDMFTELKKCQRNVAYETLAVMYSQKYNKLDHHPYLYEYYYGIENGIYRKEDLIAFLKGA